MRVAMAALALVAAAPAPRLPLARAVVAAEASIAACRAKGAHVAVEVKDASGTTVAILVDDGAAADAIAAVRLRNLIVLRYKAASGTIEDRAKADPAFAAEVAGDPRAKAAERGALPITGMQGFIGAYGVAGAGDGAADEECARAGLTRIGLAAR